VVRLKIKNVDKKQYIVRYFTWLEYGIAISIGMILTVALCRGLLGLFPDIYDYTKEEDFIKLIKENEPNVLIGEVRESYRDAHFWRYALDNLLGYIFFAVGITVSAIAMQQLFKKYRSLQFRERLKRHFSPTEPNHVEKPKSEQKQ